jgi:hypothetical protein
MNNAQIIKLRYGVDFGWGGIYICLEIYTIKIMLGMLFEYCYNVVTNMCARTQ